MDSGPIHKEIATIFMFMILATCVFTFMTVPLDEVNISNGTYIVQGGDTLYSIGLNLGVPWEEIAMINHINSPYPVESGEVLKVPVYDQFCAEGNVKMPIRDTLNLTYGAPTYQPEGPVNADKRVIIRFDDGYQDQWAEALPILAQYGYHAVFAIIDSYQTDNGECTPYQTYAQSYYMNWPEVQWLAANGNEISDHTLNHQNMTTLSASGLFAEVVASKQLFQSHGIDPMTLTLPFGNGYGNSTVISYVLGNGFNYVYTVTGVDGAATAIYPYNATLVQWHDIDISTNQSLAYFESVVNQANSTYVVGLTFHSVGSDAINDTYETNTPNFSADMAYLHSSGFDVVMPWQLPGINLTQGE